MIKYLIFDWGGVCTFGHLLKDFSNNLAIKTGTDKEKIESAFRELEYTYETGKVSPEKFWNDFREKSGLTIDLEEIRDIFLNSYVLNQEVLDHILKLKNRYKIVLFTNNYEDLFLFIKKKYNLERYFDFMFSSSDIKHKKPELESYEWVVKKLAIDPKEVIFIDDKESNVISAKELGWQAHLYTNFDDFNKIISKI